MRAHAWLKFGSALIHPCLVIWLCVSLIFDISIRFSFLIFSLITLFFLLQVNFIFQDVVDKSPVQLPFASRHDQDMLQCLSSILRTNLPDWDTETKDTATLPMSLGPQRTPHQQVSPLGKLG